MTGPFQEPKSFTAVACGTERIVLKRQAILDAGRQFEAQRMGPIVSAALAVLAGGALFVGLLVAGSWLRFGVWPWELPL